jgi:uncharacterized DUF497 family protein
MGSEKGRHKQTKARGYFSGRGNRVWDPLAITFADPDHSEAEERYITFGLSIQKRLFVVSHASRGNKTRIISARLMNRKERTIYEEG